MDTIGRPDRADFDEGYAPVRAGRLYYRQVGQGRPIIVIHGGADLDHTYLLPDMDRLSDSYRLIYYDQRGRGKSVGDVTAISVATEIEDLDSLRAHLNLASVALLGHSWDGYLAMEYTLRHPERVSHLILMNSCVATHEDFKRWDRERRRRLAVHDATMPALTSSAAFKAGERETVVKRYRLYVSTTIKRPEHLRRLNLDLKQFSDEDILRARAIEQRLFNETILNPAFDRIDALHQLRSPTLILHGDYDFVPVATIAPIAGAINGSHFVLLKDCGHFAYLEAPGEVRRALAGFFGGLGSDL